MPFIDDESFAFSPTRSTARSIPGVFTSTSESIVFQIFDEKGRVVFRKSATEEMNFSVNMNGMSSGIYFYETLDGASVTASGKFMVVKTR